MSVTIQQKLFHTLRLAIAMCFIGHGAFGIITKPIWCNYFAVLGIEQATAYQLMPWLGSIDILLGLIMLLYPVRAVAGWLFIWGIITASLRPLSGEPFAELIERAGNFGAPLAFLILTGLPSRLSGWFSRVDAPAVQDGKKFSQLVQCLIAVCFLLLLGHGLLNLGGKKGLIDQYASIGFHNPVNVSRIIGIAEIIAAASLLVKPLRPLLFSFFIWKMISELWYPHWEIFEWIERGGSYGCLLALWFAIERKKSASEVYSIQ